MLLETVREGLGDELAVLVKDLFVEAILRRKPQIEQNAMPVQPQ